MSKYIIQKAVLPEAVKKKLQQPLDFYADHFLLQPKYDGCCAIVKLFPYGGFEVRTRTNEVILSMDHIAQALGQRCHADIQLSEGLVFIGEAWWPGNDEQPNISGAVRQHSPEPRLRFVANDILTMAEFDAGYSAVPYKDRKNRCGLNWPSIGDDGPLYFATTLPPGSIDPTAFAQGLVSEGGYDGAILRDSNGTWTVGNGTTGEILKVKPLVSYDLEIVGYKEGLGKDAGSVGALQFRWRDGQTVWARGGNTQEKTAWLNDPSLVLGKIGEVEAMGLTPGGLLREPRFKGLRFDKISADI